MFRKFRARYYHNHSNARRVIVRSDGVLKITGLVEEGFEIIVKIDKRGNIVTAYPDIVKNLAKGAL